MKRNFLRSVLACVLVVTVSTFTVLAQSPSGIDGNAKMAAAPAPVSSSAKTNDKLKSDVLKMVAETRAGRVGAPRDPQSSPTHRNNLSKTAKIAIVAGIVLVVVAIIVWRGFQYDCKSRCVL